MTAPVCKATGLKTVEAARICQALVIAGVPFDFIPGHVIGRLGHSVAVPAKHAQTLETAVSQATNRVPTVGKETTA